MKVNFKKISLAVIIIMGMLLATNPTFAANQVTADGTVIADREHLRILNSLQGTDVSYGEIVEKVFPEAAKTIPENILAEMYKQPFIWNTSKNKHTLCNQPLQLNTCESESVRGTSLPPILYSGGSSIGIGNPISFVSDTTITYPSGYCVPYISAVSLLFKEGETDCIASATKSYNNSSMAVAAGKKFNPTTGKYRTQGCHYISFPPGYVIPYTTFGSDSEWKFYP